MGRRLRYQAADVNDHPRKTATAEFAELAEKIIENEFNDKSIMTIPCVPDHICGKCGLLTSFQLPLSKKASEKIDEFILDFLCSLTANIRFVMTLQQKTPRFFLYRGKEAESALESTSG